MHRVPIDLGADPLLKDRIVGVFGIIDRTIVNLLCNWEVRRVVFPIVLRSASNRVNCEVRRVVFPIVLSQELFTREFLAKEAELPRLFPGIKSPATNPNFPENFLPCED